MKNFFYTVIHTIFATVLLNSCKNKTVPRHMNYLLLVFIISTLFCGCSFRQQESEASLLEAKSMEDIVGKKVAVITGSTQELYLSRNYPDITALQYYNNSDLLTALEHNKVDCCFIDSVMLLSIQEENHPIQYLFTAGEGGDFGVAFNKGNQYLCRQFNEFLSQVKNDGTLEILNKRWLTGKAAMAPMTKQTCKDDAPVLEVGISTGYPFVFARGKEWCGFECDLMVLFGNQTGRRIEFKIYDFNGIIPALSTNKIDAAIAMITISEERKQEILFSDPYYHCSDAIFCKSQEVTENMKIPSLNELDGHSIALITGSIHDQYIQKHYPNSPIIRMNDFTDILMSLESDKCDFIVMTGDVFPDMVAKYPNLRNLGTLFSDNICAGFNKEDAALCQAFNDMLKELRESGEFDKIRHRWFDAEKTEALPHFNIPQKGKPLVVGISGHEHHYCEIEGDEYEGLEPELCYRLAERLHRPIEFRIMNFGGLIPALNVHKVDMILSQLIVTEERKKTVLFSDPYHHSSVIAVTKVCDKEKTSAFQFVKNIKESFYSNLIVESRWKMLTDGLYETLIISIFSIILGTLIGCFICWLSMSRHKMLKTIAGIYIEILRDVPILVFLMIMFYVVFAHSTMTATWVAIIAFSMNFGAFVSVIFKTGIEGVDKGQRDAGYALGFSKIGTFFNIIVPQALRSIIPVFKNEAVSLIKNTSIVGYIAIQDLTKISDIIRSRTFDAFFPLIIISIIYFILAWLLGKGLDRLTPKNPVKKAKKVGRLEIRS